MKRRISWPDRSIARMDWFLGALIVAFLMSSAAEAKKLIPFQAKLQGASGQAVSNIVDLVFTIHSVETGGAALAGWQETHSNVSAQGGIINVVLGDSASLNGINFGSTAGPRYLSVRIGSTSSPEMLPRHRLIPSFHARSADAPAYASVTPSAFASSAVQSAHIEDDSILMEDFDPAVQTLIQAGANAMPIGGIILWDQSICPTGFGPVTGYEDLFLVADETAGVTGGASLNGHGHGGTTSSHALTIPEMPAHIHGIHREDCNERNTLRTSPRADVGFDEGASCIPGLLDMQGADTPHAHSVPPAIVSGAPAAEIRPRYRTIMMCRKL